MALARPRRERALRLRVPASTSNVGPGFDALGIALNLALTVSWEPADRNRLERTGSLAESVLPSGRDPVLRGMRRAAILVGGKLPTGALRVSAPFPPGRGLGASGAGLVAGLLLGARLCGGQIPEETLLEEAIGLEGHPENAVASLLGGAHWSAPREGGGWVHLPLTLHRDLRFLVVVPPYPLATSRAREVLPSSVSFARAMGQARRTPVLLEGLRSLDPVVLRSGIQDELHVDARLKLLTGAKPMLETARAAGALAATLSGAGSSLLILTRSGRVQAVEERLGARVKRLWGESGNVLRARVETRGATFL